MNTGWQITTNVILYVKGNYHVTKSGKICLDFDEDNYPCYKVDNTIEYPACDVYQKDFPTEDFVLLTYNSNPLKCEIVERWELPEVEERDQSEVYKHKEIDIAKWEGGEGGECAPVAETANVTVKNSTPFQSNVEAFVGPPAIIPPNNNHVFEEVPIEEDLSLSWVFEEIDNPDMIQINADSNILVQDINKSIDGNRVKCSINLKVNSAQDSQITASM